MIDKLFKGALCSVAIVFTYYFSVLIVPQLIENPDIQGALSAGFVNPFASAYTIDASLCWVVLAILVLYDAKVLNVKYGWVCLLLGLIPGVAVGLPLYFVLRHKQVHQVAAVKS